MKRRSNKKKRVVSILLVILLLVTVGYAVVVSQLKLIGYTSLTKNTWKVYWDNAQLTQGSATSNPPVIEEDEDDPENTKVTFTTTLSTIGDFYEFTIDAVNESTVDAMITAPTKSASPTLPSFIKYTVTYTDGVEVIDNQILPKAKDANTPTIETYKIRVEFSPDVTTEELENMEDNVTYSFAFTGSYVKATSDGRSRAKHIPSCPGCVFAYYTNEKIYTDYDDYDNPQQRSLLTNYTDDYSALKRIYYTDKYDYEYDTEQECNNYGSLPCTRQEDQRQIFLGHILDNNDLIQRGFVCVIKNENPICIEGKANSYMHPFDTDAYIRGRNLVHDLWGSDWDNDCEEEPVGTEYSPYVRCQTSLGESYYIGVSNNPGYNDWHADNDKTNESCWVTYSGEIGCSEN